MLKDGIFKIATTIPTVSKMYRLYIDIKDERDALFLQQFLHESLWRQRAMRQGKEDLTVHFTELPTEHERDWSTIKEDVEGEL